MATMVETLVGLAAANSSTASGPVLAYHRPSAGSASARPALPRAGGVAWAVQARARETPDQLACVFTGEGRRTWSATCAELFLSARRAAGALAARGVQRGEAVLICLESGPELLSAFLGCSLLGAVPAVAEPPSPGAHAAAQVARLLDATKARALVAEASLAQVAPAALSIPVAELSTGSPEGAPAPRPPASTEMAFLQVDAAAGRAMPVTHRELQASARALAQSGHWLTAGCAVSCRSLHDGAGLFGGALAPLLCGVPLVMMSAPGARGADEPRAAAV
jgi:acyl-CoA synthetase (AMP-forming)/AMP-acid ligase II